MTAPTVAGLLTFVRNVMGVQANYLPDSSTIVQHAFDQALNIVNLDLTSAPAQTTSWDPYGLAVYNLAGHLICEFAQDQSYALSALSWANGYATATTAVAHAMLPGDRLTISSVSPIGYSGPPTLGYVQVQAVPDATHFSYALSPDPGAATLLAGAAATERYFLYARQQYKMTSFVPGVVTSANDLSTGAGLLNPEFMRSLTLENLQLLKTPYGQAYLSAAQKYGPNIWGVN